MSAVLRREFYNKYYFTKTIVYKIRFESFCFLMERSLSTKIFPLTYFFTNLQLSKNSLSLEAQQKLVRLSGALLFVLDFRSHVTFYDSSLWLITFFFLSNLHFASIQPFNFLLRITQQHHGFYTTVLIMKVPYSFHFGTAN